MEDERMNDTSSPGLSFDEVDDLLYFTRVNEVQELQQALTELAQKYRCQPREVLQAGIDPNSGNTVLHYCSANGFSELLQNLLTQIDAGGSDTAANSQTVGLRLFDVQNKEGSTPLHWAAYNGQLEVVKLLVAAGADTWIKNSAGHLAMFEAERADKNEVVQYLLEVGGRKVEQVGQEGQASAEDEVQVEDGEARGSIGSAAPGASEDGKMEE
ncbi:hypothetical protein B0A50_06388 [Salinomyces thailandicus]|uniref:Uncharacterized protein n=1 Tax=Salinomyces thailandicus TaxID=706561 RepID=A0A4U0TR77_9PEZI|nr:hypothetical protein B0A50_06388 [Salinomyces thailandica]